VTRPSRYVQTIVTGSMYSDHRVRRFASTLRSALTSGAGKRDVMVASFDEVLYLQVRRAYR